MNEHNITEMINAIGALAESAKIVYDRFLDAGFTEHQALSLTSCFIHEIVRPKNGGADDS